MADDPNENGARIEAYTDEAGEWRWRLRHANGNVLAESGEGYANRGDIRVVLRRLSDYFAAAPTVWEE